MSAVPAQETDALQRPVPKEAAAGQQRRCGLCKAALLAVSLAVAIGAVVVLLLIVFATSPAELPPPCTVDCANFSHAAWSAVLAARLRPSSRGGVSYLGFDYEGLRADQAEFRQYLQQLAGADLMALGAAERKALFINAYNALAVRKLLDECPGQHFCHIFWSF